LFLIQNPLDQNSINSNLFIERSIEQIKKEQLTWKREIKGANPKIFKYQFGPKDGFDSRILWMNFYENIDVYAAFGNKDKLDKIDQKAFNFLTGLFLGIDIT